MTPFLQDADSQLRAWIATATGVDEMAFDPSAAGENRILLMAGPSRDGDASIGISFSGTASPRHQVNQPDDPRLLGVMLHDALPVELPVAALPADFNFDDPHVLFAQGWSAAETDGRWTDGPRTRLLCRLQPGTAVDLLVSMHFRMVYLAGSGKLNVTASVAGKPADAPHELVPFAEADLQFHLPAAWLLDGYLPIQLDIANPVSPREAGTGEDARRLGVMLERLRIEPAATAPVAVES